MAAFTTTLPPATELQRLRAITTAAEELAQAGRIAEGYKRLQAELTRHRAIVVRPRHSVAEHRAFIEWWGSVEVYVEQWGTGD